MATLIKEINPINFWNHYADLINSECKTRRSLEIYSSDEPSWTKLIMQIANDVIDGFYADDGNHPKWKVINEYLHIDSIGYLSDTDNPIYSKSPYQYDWELKIAYEHENSNKWHDELSKLCQIVAELKVISSYHDYSKRTQVEDKLKKYIDRLGASKMLRVPDSSWLFVFGPRVNYSDKFRAFTIDNDFDVIEITSQKEVKPNEWI